MALTYVSETASETTSETGTLEQLRERLEDDRSALVARLAGNHHDDYALTATHGHGETEMAVRDGQRTIDAALEAEAVGAIEAVDDALARFDAGTYGRCVSCGHEIPLERLWVIPAAARCVQCQQRAPHER